MNRLKQKEFLILFQLIVLILFTSNISAQSGQLHSIDALLKEGMIKEAIKKVSETRLTESEDSFLNSKIQYILGNYQKASELISKAEKDSALSNEIISWKNLLKNKISELKSWQKQSTQHWIIYYQSAEDKIIASHLPSLLDKSAVKLQELWGESIQWPVVIKIHNNIDEFSADVGIPSANIEASGTAAITDNRMIYLLSPKLFSYGYLWPEVTTHEYMHIVMNEIAGHKLPVWFEEGVATLYQCIWDSSPPCNPPPIVNYYFDKALKKNSIVPWGMITTKSFANLDITNAMIAYAQSLSFISYLRQRVDDTGLKQLIESIGINERFFQTFEKVVHVEKNIMERWWLTKEKGMIHTPPGLLPFLSKILKGNYYQDELENVNSKEIRDKILLGDLLGKKGYWKGAVYEYKQALDKITSPNPILTSRLAKSFIKIEDYEEAVKLLNPIILLYPDFSPAYINLGIAYKGKKAPGMAQYYLEKGWYIDPYIQSVNCELARISQELKMEKKAQMYNSWCNLLE